MNAAARRRSARLGGLGAAVAVWALLLGAAGDARAGDPDLDWQTIETTHFHVHYDKSLEAVASRVAVAAEAVHGRIGAALGHIPTEYTEIVLTDDTDSANGSATAIPYNTIRLFVTAPDDLSTIGDYDDWYLDLVTHEYTHIAHTDNISGLPAIINKIIGKTYAPNQVQPRWILEGLAVVEESEHSSAGRIRSSLFDMYLRADVIENRIAGLDQISSDAYRWPQGDLWYLYGSKFLRWVIDEYGPNTVRAVAADYGAMTAPWQINRSIRRATGRTYVELFEGWKDHIARQYAEQMREVTRRGLREGRRLTRHGRNVAYPRFVPRSARAGAADEIVYYRDDLSTRSGLYRLTVSPGDVHDEELVARTTDTASPAFTPTGDLVYECAAWWNNLYSRHDVFSIPRGKTSTHGEESFRRQLTHGLRAEAPDVSADGRKIAFTVNSKGTRFLEIADVEADGSVTHRRDLVPSARWEQAYTPRFSPDGKKLAYSSWTAGGYRDIRLVDVETGKFHQVTYDRSLDMQPAWSPDGKTLYFSSDRTGIFNVYAYDVAADQLKQVTNVRTGAYMPAVSEDGRTLVYVGYTSYGFDLYSMAIDPARFLEALPAPMDRGEPPADPVHVPMKHMKYNPLATLRPYQYSASIAPSAYSANAITVTASGADVAQIHSLAASITADPRAPSPNVSLDYAFNRLPVGLSLHVFHAVAPRGGYRLNDTPVNYDQTTNGITSGVSYVKLDTFSSHSFGLSLSVANFKGYIPIPQNPDPYAASQPEPQKGNINIAHFGYGFTNVEGGYDQSGVPRGVYTNVGVDLAGAYTGSSFTVHSVNGQIGFYLEMPWLKHTLAYRITGAVMGGNFTPSGAYSVGGYDLQNNSLVSTVLSGAFDGTFALRGYPPGVYYGNEYVLQNVEYRFPLLYPDHGISTLPLYLKRIDGNLFFDYGGAFDAFDVQGVRFFSNGALIDAPQLHASVGGEIWFGTTIGYGLGAQIRLGYAYGFSPEAEPGGQWYFVAASAF